MSGDGTHSERIQGLHPFYFVLILVLQFDPSSFGLILGIFYLCELRGVRVCSLVE